MPNFAFYKGSLMYQEADFVIPIIIERSLINKEADFVSHVCITSPEGLLYKIYHLITMPQFLMKIQRKTIYIERLQIS